MKTVMLREKILLDRCLKELTGRFSCAGIESASTDARLLIGAVTGYDHAGLILNGNEVLCPAVQEEIEKLALRRLAFEPVSKILGVREFYGREFSVNQHVLDPRPDTETVIDVALKVIGRGIGDSADSVDILDIGTGTGAIIITLLCEIGSAKGVATDLSPDALQVARDNGEQLGVADRLELKQAFWCEGLSRQFELIVSNPPYIKAGDIANLPTDVRKFDPHLALDGGNDGLDAYRALAELCSARLKNHGVIIMEVGFDQADDVVGLFKAAGFGDHATVEKVTHDLSGRPRVVTLVKG
jgi:release factor glutamine methyltransferase